MYFRSDSPHCAVSSSRFVPPDASLSHLSLRGPSSLSALACVPWEPGERWNVEFFPGVVASVRLVSADAPDLDAVLRSYADGAPIALDCEWKPDLAPGSNNPIALLQFCTSRGALIVKGAPRGPLRRFLSSHRFFAKGAAIDALKLRDAFGPRFAIDLEDVQETRLLPHGLCAGFAGMVQRFAGAPSAEFKDRRVALSDWSAAVLSKRQILYAAFDVVALYQCFCNFPPPKPPPRLCIARADEIRGAPPLHRNPARNYFLVRGLGAGEGAARARLERLRFLSGITIFGQSAIVAADPRIAPAAVAGVLRVVGFANNALIVFAG